MEFRYEKKTWKPQQPGANKQETKKKQISIQFDKQTQIFIDIICTIATTYNVKLKHNILLKKCTHRFQTIEEELFHNT